MFFELYDKGNKTMFIELIEKRVEPSEDYYFKVIPNDTKGISKRYEISMDDAEKFYNKYADNLRDTCNIFIGDGDVEMFGKEECARIEKWAQEVMKHEKDKELMSIIKVLYNYAKEAIKLDTWIVIEI